MILEDLIEEDYIMSEVTENSQQVAVEVLQHYGEKKQQKELKQVKVQRSLGKGRSRYGLIKSGDGVIK